jgi:hypothetical protein
LNKTTSTLKGNQYRTHFLAINSLIDGTERILSLQFGSDDELILWRSLSYNPSKRKKILCLSWMDDDFRGDNGALFLDVLSLSPDMEASYD